MNSVESTLIDEALRSARETKAIRIGTRILNEVPALFQSQFSSQPAMIVADTNTFAAAGRSVMDALMRSGVSTREPFVFSDPALFAEHNFVTQLESALAGRDAIPIAVGSGTINDLTKLAAHRTGREYMAVATAASMDGYTAYGASITYNGSKQTFDCPAPRAVLADLEVIASAPAAMNAWGYADLLAKLTAGADWILADELGVEPVEPQAWRIVQVHLRDWIAHPEGIRRGDQTCLEKLLSGLLLSGFAMQATCSSRPASGAEHQFSHLWDMENHEHDGRPVSHGAKVGVATVAVAQLYEFLREQPVAQLDVETLVARWPDGEAVLRSIHELFHTSELAEKARVETIAKHIPSGVLREQLQTLRVRWPAMKSRLGNQLPPAIELAQMLTAAGAPAECEQIGISQERLKRSFRLAYHIRRRFTVLDLTERLGLLDRWIQEPRPASRVPDAPRRST